MKRPNILHRLQRPRNLAPATKSRAQRFWHAMNKFGVRAKQAASSLFIFSAGSAPAELARIPAAERRTVKVEGALVCCTTIFVCAVFASAMIIAKMSPLVIIPLLGLLAAFWLLIDRSLLAAFNMADGERLAERYRVPGFFPVSARRRGMLVAGRIAFSVMAMAAATIMARTVIFADDIDRHIAVQHKKANVKVRAKAEALVDRQIGDAQSAFNQAVKERNEVRGLISQTDLPADTKALDAELEAERKSVLDAKQRYADLVIAFNEAKRGAAAERAGVQAGEGDSGVPGEGSRWEYHKNQMDAIRGQASALRAATQRSLQRIRELEAQKTGAKADHVVQGEQGRTALNPRLAEAEEKVVRLSRQRTDLVAKRAVSVRKMTEADPAFVPMSNGLIARVQALDAVQTGSLSALIISIALTALFSLMELSVLLLRVINGTPHIVGAEKVEQNVVALEQIFGPCRAKALRTKARPQDRIWLTVNDNSRHSGDGKAA